MHIFVLKNVYSFHGRHRFHEEWQFAGVDDSLVEYVTVNCRPSANLISNRRRVANLGISPQKSVAGLCMGEEPHCPPQLEIYLSFKLTGTSIFSKWRSKILHGPHYLKYPTLNL